MPKQDWHRSKPLPLIAGVADTPLRPFLERLISGEDLSPIEAAGFFTSLLDENAQPAQIAGALVALAAKGETPAELAGMADVMRKRAIRITSRQKGVVDTSGTGSSAAKTFNISTAAAFVAAGAGATVAKHTNRGVATKCGSADVLEKLGIKITGEPETAQAALSGTGLAFLFAAKFHPALRRLGDVKRNLGIRTTLNLLGVLGNPARASRQIVGVWHPQLIKPIAQALSLLGAQHAWVVHGSDGLDELTISGETYVAEVLGDKVKTFKVTPEDFGLTRGATDHLRIKTPAESAQIITDVLLSKRRDEARALVVMNAAAAIMVAGLAKQPLQAARLAEQSIDSDSARVKLDRIIQVTNK
jgi:anthranilate phosphoribosyltransferase